MQDFPNQPTPSGSTFGSPPSPAKKPGLSKGCLVGIIAAAVLVIGGLIVVALAATGLYWFNRQAPTISRTNSPGGTKTTPPSSASDDSSDVENPAPTSAQSAAISGGQTATWAQQEISWTVPQKWGEHTADSRSFLWRSPGSFDAANLIVSVSPMSADFPTEISIKAFYDGAQTRKQNGEVDELRWLRLGGLKGIEFRESAPEDADNPQRLQWMGYRNYKGQVQLVNIMLSARGKDFARHEDALKGILYSTKFSE
ncbi:MAG TPA: transmembrane domain-containing protein [Pyrinomonadaceae bacterium]|nr:transmembrane domain-containing protein [Pyrinomonadaceae bacterium]